MVRDIDICLGIVEVPTPHQLSIVVINFSAQSVAFFHLGEKADDFSEHLAALNRFLASEISNPTTLQVVVEIPSFYWLGFRSRPTRLCCLKTTSLLYKVLLDLDSSRYCLFLHDAAGHIGPISDIARFFNIPERADYQLAEQALFLAPRSGVDVYDVDSSGNPVLLKLINPPARLIMPLPIGFSQSYAQFLFGSCPEPRWIALAAALIGKDYLLYNYLLSEGIVHSSQDIVQFIKYRQRASEVVSGDFVYSISPSPVTKLHTIEKIPLKYAVTAKKSEALEYHALKFALLACCKFAGLKLEYSSLLDKELRGLIYDPQKTLDSWIINALQ